jgi:nitrate/nitrite transporter NarK
MNQRILFSLMVGLALGVTFMNIPPALATLMGLYHVTYVGISVLLSALLWSHALMQIPAGLVADRLGMGRTLVTGMILLAGGNLFPAVAPILSLAVVGRVITGLGTGLIFVATLKFIAQNAPGGRVGMYQAFFAGVFSLGTAIAYVLIPIALKLGWQWIYLVPGIFGLALLVLWSLFSFEIVPLPRRKPVPLARIIGIRAGWVIGSFHALSWGTAINLGNWIPSLLAESWQDSTASQLAWGAILVMLISGLGRIAGGFVLLRLSPLWVANGSILVLSIASWGLFALPSPNLALLLALSAALLSCINFGAFFHLASTVTDTDSLATLLGFVNFLANVGAILFTMLLGFSKDTTGTLTWGFGLLGMLGLAAFILGGFILRRDCSGDSCYQEL